VKPIVGSSGNPKNSFEIIGTKPWVRPEIIHIDAELCALPIPADILSGALQIIAFVTNTFFCTTAIQQIQAITLAAAKMAPSSRLNAWSSSNAIAAAENIKYTTH